MSDKYDAFLDSPSKHDAFLDAPETPTKKPVVSFKDEKPSIVQSLFAKYAPDVPAFAMNFAGGTADLPRRALEAISSGTGEKVFPSGYMDKSSLAYNAGTFFDPVSVAIGGVAGKVASKVLPTVLPTVAAGMPAAVEKLGRTMGRNTLSGGLAGATSAAVTGGDAEDIAVSGGYGALIGGSLTPAGRILQKGTGWATDVVKGRAADVKAGQIARAAAGGNLDAIRIAMRNAPDTLTAGQAAYGIDQDMWQALQKLAKDKDPSSYYRVLADKQVANRASTLANVTPDLKAAEVARSAAMTANMAPVTQNAATVRAAQEATMMPPKPIEGANPFRGVGGAPERAAGQIDTFPAVPALETLKGNPVITAMIADARRMAASRKNLPEEFARLTKAEIDDIIKDPTKSVNGLRMMKAVIDNRFKNPESTASVISKMSDGEAAAIKSSLMGAAETAAPGWSAARQQFGQMSVPVNQSRVLGELSSVLDKPNATGERVTPFLNALGRGEDTALGRAGLNTRFGGIEDVLDPTQMTAVNTVKGELIRDAALKDQASRGVGGLRDVLEGLTTTFRLPAFMSTHGAAANKTIELMEKNLSAKTIQALVEGMKSGKSATDLLNTLPTAESNKLRLIFGQLGNVAPYAAAAAGSQE